MSKESIDKNGKWEHFQKIGNPDKNKADNFGASVAIDGDTAVVGANLATGSKPKTGAIYVFKNSSSGWKFDQKLFATDGLPDDNFGQCVSLSGNVVAVGAYTQTTKHSGAVYVFTRKSTTEKFGLFQKLEPTSTDTRDNYFGRSVSVHGVDLIVGAWGDSSVAKKSGSVYFYRLPKNGDKYELLSKIYHPDKQASAYFGFSVSVYNTLVVVGSHGDSTRGSNSGAIFVFLRTGHTWKHFDTQYPSRPRNANTQFGYQVDVEFNRILVSAYRDDNDAPDGGSCYVYTYSDEKIQKVKRINASDVKEYDAFGSGVSIGRDYAIVGSSGDDDLDAKNRGSVHMVMIPETVHLEENDPTPTPTPSATPTPSPTPTVQEDECIVTIYYEIYLKDGEQSARLVSDVHDSRKLKKSNTGTEITETLIKLNKPNIVEGDPKVHFIKNFRATPGEVLKGEVKILIILNTDKQLLKQADLTHSKQFLTS